jgi:hypothetical protein
MKPRHLLMATAMAASLVLMAAAPVGAAPPTDSGHLNYDVARVHLSTGGLWECDGGDAAGASIEFGFIDGDLLMIPIGHQPGDWTDFDPFIQVYGCDGAYWSLAVQSHDLRDEYGPANHWINLYDSAYLAVADRQLWQGDSLSPYYATVDLTWEGIGSPVTNSWMDGKHKVTERWVPAQVTGEVTITGWEGPWGDTLTFTAEGSTEDGTNLAHVSEVWGVGIWGTTTIAQADAWFSSPVADSETCDTDNLYINLGEDAYKGPGGEGRPPTLSGWLDVHMWHESGCDPGPREQLGFVQETWNGLDPSQYSMDSLSSAWVNIVFEFHDGDAVMRTLSLDLAWVAEGDRVVVKGRDGMIVNGWERSAQLSGAITDSWELIDIGDLDRANMMTAHYLMR